MDYPHPMPMDGLQRSNSGDRFVLGMLSPDVGGGALEEDIIKPMRNLNLQKDDGNDTIIDRTDSTTNPCTTNSSVLEDLNSEPYDWKSFLIDPNGTSSTGSHRQVKKPIRKPSEAAQIFLRDDGCSQDIDSKRKHNKKSEAATLFLKDIDEDTQRQHLVNTTVPSSLQEIIPSNNNLSTAFEFREGHGLDPAIGSPPAAGNMLHPSKKSQTCNDMRCYLPQKPYDKPKIRHYEAKKGCKRISANPTNLDILLGRGTSTNNHAGNIRFRKIVAEEKSQYVSLGKSKKEKTYFSQHIVNTVNEYGGRFLQRDKITRKWFIVDPDVARKKTSQALRES